MVLSYNCRHPCEIETLVALLLQYTINCSLFLKCLRRLAVLYPIISALLTQDSQQLPTARGSNMTRDDMILCYVYPFKDNLIIYEI